MNDRSANVHLSFTSSLNAAFIHPTGAKMAAERRSPTQRAPAETLQPVCEELPGLLQLVVTSGCRKQILSSETLLTGNFLLMKAGKKEGSRRRRFIVAAF